VVERLFDEVALLPPEEGRQRFEEGEPQLSAFVDMLGSRTGELHRALAQQTGDPGFDPVPMTAEDAAAWRRRAREQARAALDVVASAEYPMAKRLTALGDELLRRIDQALPWPLSAKLSRIHGDYHLGQVLVVNNDVAIIDFEGEPARPLSARRAKDSPLRDVAGMLRSFDYAASSVLARMDTARPGSRKVLGPLAASGVERAGARFLRSYLAATMGLSTVPSDSRQMAAMLELFLIEKACYEVCYEAANRPAWRPVPVRGVLKLLNVEEADSGQGE